MTAGFNPPVISVNGFDLPDEVPADIPLQVLVEKQFDIFTQFTLITLQANEIIKLFINDLMANFALAPHRINGHDRAFDVQQFQQFQDGSDLIGFIINLALSENEFLLQAQAETMWMAAWLEMVSNERRRIFPSTATTPSSVSFRLATQLMKQLWNTSISSRENRIPS